MADITRRHFAGVAAMASFRNLRAQSGRPPRILLRSSWQSVNIGDIGHTPGALALLWKYIPEAEITLWPGQLGHGSRDLLTKGYPRLKIAEGSLNAEQKPGTPALAKAWEEADLYLSGSGSGFPASNHAVAFQKATNKPVGVFGVSTDPISGFGGGRLPEGGTLKQIRERALKLPADHLEPELRYIIDRAAFFFCRDTISRDYLKAQQVKTPILEFGPDAQLGMTLRDDAKGFAWLQEHGLEERKFICVIPRLRYTPYYKVRNTPRTPADEPRDAINNRTTEGDHRKLRDMITAYVRKTRQQSNGLRRDDLPGGDGQRSSRRPPARRRKEERSLARHLLAARRSGVRLFKGPGRRQRRVPLPAYRAPQRNARHLRAPAHRYV
ncbi:MAG: polysaccharide pyruvyl transferase family protein [Bryobacteraceae bacterium]|nr:polysaccharide pyruvyl transferase family protein [Bryobacteraceae bacterium]